MPDGACSLHCLVTHSHDTLDRDTWAFQDYVRHAAGICICCGVVISPNFCHFCQIPSNSNIIRKIPQDLLHPCGTAVARADVYGTVLRHWHPPNRVRETRFSQDAQTTWRRSACFPPWPSCAEKTLDHETRAARGCVEHGDFAGRGRDANAD